MGPTEIIICVVAAVASLFVGLLVGFIIRKKISEAKIGSAELEAKRIVEEGEKAAETLKKEALIEAKEKIIKDKNEFEKELRERRNEVTRLERRVAQREETLDKKVESYERKEENLRVKIKEQEELIEKTGGIVQGMSGSPVIQDGCLIGAVTHVFVDDPLMGYGLYIEWMLEEADRLAQQNAA